MPLVVQKMTATSTTSTNEDSTTDSESREIQNALDKKRKKRRHSGSNESSELYKHLKQGKGLKKVVLIWTNGSEVGMFDEHGSVYSEQIIAVERDGTWHEVNHG